MSQGRTEQERERIRQRKKAVKAAQRAVADARVAARNHINGLDPAELEEEQKKCLDAWLEEMFPESGSVLYGNPLTGTFSPTKPFQYYSVDTSRQYKKTFPFLSDFKGTIKSFTVDDKGTPIVNGLQPEESHIDENSWRRFLVEETFTLLNYYRTTSLEALLEDSDNPLAVQIRDLRKRESYDLAGKLSYVWWPCDEEILDASSEKLHLYHKLMELHYGKDLRLTNVQKAASKDGWDMVFLESITHEAVCPFCGSMSRTKRGTDKKEWEDIPSRPGVRKKIVVTVNTYYGKQCAENGISDTGEKVNGYFRERLSIARSFSRRTNRLEAWIIMLVSNGCFHNAERDLRRMGCKVGDDAIRRLVMSLRFDDIPDITAIGVDDVSLRKGQSYATVIYNLAEHRLLCVLPGRDGKALRKWLDAHPFVRKIARDHGTAYAKTIDAWARDNGIEDEVVQVADRFHLIKNFVDHVKDHAYHYLPRHIAIDCNTEELMDTVPSKVAIARNKTTRPPEELMNYWNYTNDPVCDENGQPIEIILPPTGQDASDDSAMTPAQKQEENRAAKYDTYKSMREEFKATPKYWGGIQETGRQV